MSVAVMTVENINIPNNGSRKLVNIHTLTQKYIRNKIRLYIQKEQILFDWWFNQIKSIICHNFLICFISQIDEWTQMTSIYPIAESEARDISVNVIVNEMNE
jgi:hypothetical protein